MSDRLLPVSGGKKRFQDKNEADNQKKPRCFLGTGQHIAMKKRRVESMEKMFSWHWSRISFFVG